MIELTRGDILKANAEALVNTVNCVGVMGRGIALQYRKAFPEMFKAYKAMCDREELKPGMVLTHDLNRFDPPHYVINVPTKQHWRGKSSMEYVEAGLAALVEEVRRLNVKSVAVPPLGCGLGGLDWAEVRSRIEEAFADLTEVHIVLFEPAGAPTAAEMAKTEKTPNMTVGRATLLGLMRRYLAAAMDPSISLLEIHKLMYFMQESGQDLKLVYTKARFGPYAENLRHVLTHIEGHFISGYGDAADDPEKQIELRAEAVERAEAYLADHLGVQKRFDQVVDLIEGFETPFGMEILSTVHWVTKYEGATTSEEVERLTYAWNDRKRMFRHQHIGIAWRVLADKGWLGVG